MSLIDVQTLLSDRQAVTVTAFSSNQYDIGAGSPSRNIGRKDLRAIVNVNTSFTAGGAATMDIAVGTADDAAGTNFTSFSSVAAVPVATLAAGYIPLDKPVPDTAQRFVMAKYTVATGPMTAGTISCALVRGSDHQRAYPDGYTISN